MSTSPINVSSLLQAFGLGGASNIDVNTIVSELMQVDEQPLIALQNKVTGYQTTISAYGALLSGISGLQSAVTAMQSTTTGLSAASSNSSYFTATASGTPTTGSTPVQIDNIASAQSISSISFGSQTGPVADLTVDAPSENLQITNGSQSATIAVTSGNNSLSGIATAINNANIGVNASVEQVSSNYVINDGSDNTVANNTISFSYNNYNYTATLAAGNYSSTDMAAEIASAMNAAKSSNGGGAIPANTFSADYGTTATNSFTIKNNDPANNVTINWAGSTLAPQQLGFESGVQSPTIAANGGTLTGTNAVNGTYQLALTSDSTGTANRITVKVDEAGSNNYSDTDKFGLSVLAFNPSSYDSTGNPSGGTANMTQTQAGLDAKLAVNGVTLYRPNNTITDAIPGVTLNLLQAETTPGSANLKVNVSLDSSSLANELGSLVTAYNSAMTTINGLYNPVTSQTTSAQQQEGQGYLNGDSELLNLQQQLQAVPTTQYGASSNIQNNYLAAIGITTDKNGVMSFDASALSSAYTSANAGDITNMINNFANQLGSALNEYINVAVPAEEQNVNSQISFAQGQETDLAQQLAFTQQSLTTEYSDLENTVSNDASISNYLTQETAQNDRNTSVI
ncbi:MAG: flagellar filament capping protein FliD [Dissulfurispiraceae bacterium]